MQMISFSPFITFLWDCLAWFCFHMGISWIALQIPDHFFEAKAGWFQARKWEREGAVWEEMLHIRKWKSRLPDGTFLLKKGYNKSSVSDTSSDALHKLLIEMRRAELTHWLSVPPAFFFFLWNPPWAGWIMVVYAVLMNTPFILAQRYNRPRIERLYAKKREKEAEKVLQNSGNTVDASGVPERT